LIPKEKHHKQKFSNKANRYVFIRYHEGSKAYDLLVINEDGTYGKVINSRHVRFNDDEPSSTMVQPPLEPEATSREQFEEVSQSLLPRATSYYDEDDDTDIPLQPNPGSVGAPPISVTPPRDSPPQADPLPLPDDIPSVVHPSERENPPLKKVAGVRIEPP
jgi:hypothetical protein